VAAVHRDGLKAEAVPAAAAMGRAVPVAVPVPVEAGIAAVSARVVERAVRVQARRGARARAMVGRRLATALLGVPQAVRVG
jgi:hypothetical protein